LVEEDGAVGEKERMFNLPGVLTSLIVFMAAIQAIVSVAPDGVAFWLYDVFAFIPVRFSFLVAPESVLEALSGRDAVAPDAQARLVTVLEAGRSVYLTPLTYAFLHGGWTHLAINCLTLAAFGTPVARRLGDARFLAFLAACAVAGALTHCALHPLDATPVVGASAAISGTMAAIVRFGFTPGARLGEKGALERREARTPSLSRLSENRQAMLFLAVWFAANFLLGAFPQGAGSEPVAWEAHIGGFLFGLLTFGAFDHWRRRV
jgi:membrane associated rhomboid family serine protease